MFTSQMSLRGVVFGDFSVDAVAAALAAFMGVPSDRVSAAVLGVDVSTTLSLAAASGAVSNVSDMTLAALASSVATSLSVSPQQVHTVLQSASSRRRHLSQSSRVLIDVTVTGLGSGASQVAGASAGLVAPGTLTALLVNLNTAAFSGVTASPVSVAVRLLVTVQVPAMQSLDDVMVALGPSRAADLTAALQSAGIQVASIIAAAAPSPPFGGAVALSTPSTLAVDTGAASREATASALSRASSHLTSTHTVIAVVCCILAVLLFGSFAAIGAYWRRMAALTQQPSTKSDKGQAADTTAPYIKGGLKKPAGVDAPRSPRMTLVCVVLAAGVSG